MVWSERFATLPSSEALDLSYQLTSLCKFFDILGIIVVENYDDNNWLSVNSSRLRAYGLRLRVVNKIASGRVVYFTYGTQSKTL